MHEVGNQSFASAFQLQASKSIFKYLPFCRGSKPSAQIMSPEEEEDDDDDTFFGCACQRMLGVFLCLPFILFISVLGLVMFVILAPGKLCFNSKFL